jgi:hypothetical protein
MLGIQVLEKIPYTNQSYPQGITSGEIALMWINGMIWKIKNPNIPLVLYTDIETLELLKSYNITFVERPAYNQQYKLINSCCLAFIDSLYNFRQVLHNIDGNITNEQLKLHYDILNKNINNVKSMLFELSTSIKHESINGEVAEKLSEKINTEKIDIENTEITVINKNNNNKVYICLIITFVIIIVLCSSLLT